MLDADVVIDFMDAKRLADLPRILPGYDFVILDIVLDKELGKWRSTKEYVLRTIEWIKTGPSLSIIPWQPDRRMLEIYAELR